MTKREPINNPRFLWWIWVCLLGMVAGSWFVTTLHGCNCSGPTTSPDGGGIEAIPDDPPKISSTTQIRFISPQPNEIISGQITLEAEVIDADGMDTVTFWANDSSIGVATLTRDSTPQSPVYSIQVATSFLPRGVLNLTVRTRDRKGELAEKTIQVTTRERWIAAFGVGQIHQMYIRKDRHIYVRLYRSEDDMARVTNPGPLDKVGSAIVTVNAVGEASWGFLGPGEDFGSFVQDETGNMFFGARASDTGKSRLIAIGPGDTKWGPEIPIKPSWQVDLKDLIVQGTPIRWSRFLWVHAMSPARAGDPSSSTIIRYKSEDGTEEWRYAGPTGDSMEIIRGPYLVGQGMMLFLSRRPGSSSGFRIELIDATGKSVWLQAYNNLQINVVHWDAKAGRLYLGTERREQSKVVASSLSVIDPVTKQEIWRKDFDTRWPQHLSLGNNLVFVSLHPEGNKKELVALQKQDGTETWKKTLERFRVVGIQGTEEDDACLVFADYLDTSDDPEMMVVERYSAQGNVNWRYENKQFTIKSWLFAPNAQNMLWVNTRGIADDGERLGSRLIALNNRGERLYLFMDEGRVFQFVEFFPKDSLFVTSRDVRDVRVHHLIPIQ